MRSSAILVPMFRRVFFLIAAAVITLRAPAQQTPILNYIHASWDTLTRSTLQCASLRDPKVLTAPILYLPADVATPANLPQDCNVRIQHLPRPIHRLGDVLPAELPADGLLYLPNPYVVPGGRFNEQYGWDSYFILLGLLADHRTALARGMVENFFYEIDHYGALLNANRTYFLTRSQPPLLSSMILEVYGSQPDKTWLAEAYRHAQQDYDLWTSPDHRAGSTGLARYHDLGSGPVPEMADDSTYYPDVIRWLLAHPDQPTAYLLDAPAEPTAGEAVALASSSCDVRGSHVCASAYAQGHRLTAAFFSGDRAMRESGFDTTFRFGPFSGSTDHFAPVCLNALLYKYERDMEQMAEILGRPAESRAWKRRAEARAGAIDRLLWNAATGLYFDYDFTTGKQSVYPYLSTFYPLWAGLASAAQAAAVERHLADFERPGGVATSTVDSGTQWDLPYGWAPLQWLTVAGLDRYHFHGDAVRVARSFTQTVDQNFARDSTIREKYDVVSGSANIAVATGYKANVVGFGWTNGVYVRLHQLLSQPRP